MKQLLIRADDIGYSYAVNLGIARAVNEGLVRSAGLMPNMPEAQRGWDWVKDAGIAIGQHTNLCLGTPCADPALIPSLVDENGQLHSSREYRAAFKEGREFAAYDELVIEVEAQLARFREIVGHDPEYFEDYKKSVVQTNIDRLERIIDSSMDGNAGDKNAAIKAIDVMNKLVGAYGDNQVNIARNDKGDEVIQITFGK